jgi:hypothetical protein
MFNVECSMLIVEHWTLSSNREGMGSDLNAVVWLQGEKSREVDGTASAAIMK